MPDYKRLIRKKVSPKKANREIAKPSGFLNKAIFSLVLISLIVAVILGGRTLLMHFPGCEIKRASIINHKRELVSNPEDFFRLDPDNDFNLFSFDMRAVVQDIQARHPEVARVSIYKQFPNELLIVLREREPVAVIALRDFYLVDAEGFVLPFKSMHRDLPKVIGIHPNQIQLYTQSHSLRLKKALSLLQELKKAQVYPEYAVSQINVKSYSDIIFYLQNRSEVRIGQSNFTKKARLLSEVLAQYKAAEPLPEYIDMRFGDPVVRPRRTKR